LFVAFMKTSSNTMVFFDYPFGSAEFIQHLPKIYLTCALPPS
jgi:hypothetical protein